jgi:hypothetical protein
MTAPSADHSSIRVPLGAVRDGAVFVVEDGKAVRRVVVLGKTGASDVEIHKGLIGGEDLILDPPIALQDGAKVKATESKS